MSKAISFSINGSDHHVPCDLPVDVTLNEYLRNVAGLPGTKVMCQKGGCGVCVVLVTRNSPDSDAPITHTAQSCLTPLYMVDGWHITTVEALGSQKQGFHPIQERVAKFNGSQCGQCTPGIVMAMYGLLQSNPRPSKQDIEDAFDGNICRCTGYRPILDAMKSFARDSDTPSHGVIDIEDLSKHICPKREKIHSSNGEDSMHLNLGSMQWYRPKDISELGAIMRSNQDKKLKIIFGNTSSGLYMDSERPDVYVDLHAVKELFRTEIKDNELTVGAATTINQLVGILKTHATLTGFHYFPELRKHMQRVAGTHIRNVGSIAGNLMVKHAHRDFVSDLFTTFAALGCSLDIYDATTNDDMNVSMQQFLKDISMDCKIITAVKFPSLEKKTTFKSFKVAPRWQKAYAYVNAAFKMHIEDGAVRGKPALVFGGINEDTVHATETELYLTDKKLSKEIYKESLSILTSELKANAAHGLASPGYRQQLAVNLLYKFFLSVCPSLSTTNLKSGSSSLLRPVSSAVQTYQEISREFPLKHALPKKTAILQASGEAQYVGDIPSYDRELCAAFVLSEVGNATLASIDASEALAMPGVVKFFSAADLPKDGVNNYTPSVGVCVFEDHELFASKEISFCGQPVGMIIAASQREAVAAAKKVKVTYAEVRPPVTTLEESIAKGMEFTSVDLKAVKGNPESAFKSADHIIEGECKMGHQTHFYMETNISLAVPCEDGIELMAATQFPDMVQTAVAQALGKPMNYVNVKVPRLGGAFGGKAFDSCSISCAVCVAAHLLERPVRMALDFHTDMQVIGKRAPIIAKFKAGFQKTGELSVVDVDIYMEYGHTSDNPGGLFIVMEYIDMAYHVPNWHVRPHAMKTNKQTMTSVRAPGAVPAAMIMETILEQVAHHLHLQPILVKEINLYKTDQKDFHGHDLAQCTVREVWFRLKDMAEVNMRLKATETFNKENLWKKRGLSMCASKYGFSYFDRGHGARVSIFAKDGSVVVTTGGVEMGQGLHMKVAQGVSYALGIPLDYVKVRPSQSLINPNAMFTAASFTSESCMQAAIQACEILKERMKPVKEKFPEADWIQLCEKSNQQKVDLSVSSFNRHEPGTPFINYFTCSVAAVETEVDILTGESQIRRVDILADIGESLNPAIDIGQIEGAFVIGLGVYLTEDLLYDAKTGKMITDGLWEYHAPTSKDIPIDWRVHLLPDRPNPAGIRSSKAIGEPPITLPVAALFANKSAVQDARKDLFGVDQFLPSVAPYTVEQVQQSVGLTVDNLVV